MSSSTISFIAWSVFMVLIIIGLVWSARKSREIREEVEDVASKALPEIGGIAEKRYSKRFGRAATDAPGSNGQGSWYPEAKKKIAKPV
jgi:hypothetical protein